MPSHGHQTIKTGSKASQTTLTRRKGRLTSHQNATRTSGPAKRRQPPPPISIGPLGDPYPSSPGYSSSFDNSFISSPVNNAFNDNFTLPNFGTNEHENHFDHFVQAADASRPRIRTSSVIEEPGIPTKKFKVSRLYFIILDHSDAHI